MRADRLGGARGPDTVGRRDRAPRRTRSPAIEAGVAAAGFPPSFVGVVIALLVLLPDHRRAGPGDAAAQGGIHLVLLAAFLFLAVNP